LNDHPTLKNPEHDTDEGLLKRIACDDEKAFEILFDRYWETAHCLAAARLKSKEIAQEIVHDLFLDFWRRRHSLQTENFSHYLRVAIKYSTISYISQQLSRNKYFDDYLLQVPQKDEATLKTIEYNELLNALEEGVKILPEKTQQVFHLSRVEGHSIAEIAKRLNLSEKAIEYHITRSRKELRLFLKDFLVLFVVSFCFLLS
jgi:RNA polymerase sigma-70 factor (family 1)